MKSIWRSRPLLLALATAALFAIGILLLLTRGAPPRSITLATGPPGGSYATLGERYRAILAASGVELRLVSSAGDAENLAKLRDARSGVSAGFAIAGLVHAQEAPELESLGTIAYEPFWLFERSGSRGMAVEGLAGKRLALGAEGSGTRAMARKLFALAQIDTRAAEVLALPPADAAERILRGEIDAMALVADWDSPVVRRLVAAPEVSLVSFRRADAFVALEPELTKVVLPTGVGDLVANRPPGDVVLIAPKASLVVRSELHEAIQYLLLDAASRIHSRPGIFHAAGAFPAAESIDFPLTDEAVHFYKTGRPFLQRYLPFWGAVLAERLLILLIPLIGIALPLARLLPGAYRFLMERRVIALYRGLKLVETEIEDGGAEETRADVLRRLDDLERSAGRLRVPLRFSQTLYTLKQHIRLVRDRLAGGR
ncbi:MAG TPA: TAXI family TRAP transporter solute-binding subunit [Anaeromyxobacteraceae bacterium]|nr:TAXI family TRAP transporter solute-binding subunit [Anaeromyxobacteraceae bacterium]